MLFAGLFLVAWRGNNLPFGDDFAIVPALTGYTPVTLDWLWSQHNEHRLPLPRLVLLGLHKASANGFQNAMYLNVLGLAFAAFVLIGVARQLRGWTAYADAIFPLALLHWGHWENLLWQWQVGFVIPMVLVFVLLAIIVAKGAALPLRWGILMGICLLVLPLCGAPGLPFVVTLACWLGYRGVALWRSGQGHGRRDGATLLAFAAAALLLTGWYFVGLAMHREQSANPGVWRGLVVSARFLGMSFGLAGEKLWPFSAWFLLALLGLSLIPLTRAWLRLPLERPRLLGLSLFVVGVAGLITATGWGRARLGEYAGSSPRYVVLAVPALFWIYFVWQIYGGGMGHVVRGTLFLLVAVVLYANMTEGLHQAYMNRYRRLTAFERDLRDGMAWMTLAKRYSQDDGFRVYRETGYFARCLAMLSQASVAPFDRLRDARPFEGAHDPSRQESISGWVWDVSRPNTPLAVDIYADDRVIATILANSLREDLAKRGKGNGKHGFSLPVPARLKDGEMHSIRVKVSGTDFDLASTPRSFPVPAKNGSAAPGGKRAAPALGKP
jgi:hypothetical protein